MKRFLLTSLLLPLIVSAQISPPVPNRVIQRSGSDAPATSLPGNYQITLTITDKDTEPLELSVVVASPRFTATTTEQSVNFQGSINIEEAGTALIEYALGWGTPQAQPSIQPPSRASSTSMTGSVRLKLGEEVTIIKAASRVARLSIKPLGTPSAK
jgi:hypothetical protein